MYQARKVNGQIHTCTKSTVRYIHVPSQVSQEIHVNGQIHTCTKPGKSTVRYIHVPSQESQRSDTYMYQTRKINGQIHTCKARKVNGQHICQIHTCTKPGKSDIHVLSQESQRDTYMY